MTEEVIPEGHGVMGITLKDSCSTCKSKYPEADCVDGDYVERNIIPDSLLCPNPFHNGIERWEDEGGTYECKTVSDII